MEINFTESVKFYCLSERILGKGFFFFYSIASFCFCFLVRQDGNALQTESGSENSPE